MLKHLRPKKSFKCYQNQKILNDGKIGKRGKVEKSG